MYETDDILRGDPEYLDGMRLILAELQAEKPGKACGYHPQGGRLSDVDKRKLEYGSFISGAQFAVGELGEGPMLSLDRGDIRTCSSGVTPEVQAKIKAL